MIKYKGKLYFQQYIKNKPIKWGIEGFVMYDSEDGY